MSRHGKVRHSGKRDDCEDQTGGALNSMLRSRGSTGGTGEPCMSVKPGSGSPGEFRNSPAHGEEAEWDRQRQRDDGGLS